MPKQMPPGASAETREVNGEPLYVGRSLPIHIRYESDWGDPLGADLPIVKYFYRDRRLSTWAIGAKPLLDGSLDRALRDPVRLCMYLRSLPADDVEGHMYAEPVNLPPEPANLIQLGPFRHRARRRYGRSEGERAAIDAVLHYLYWKPDLAAERLITDITSKGIFS